MVFGRVHMSIFTSQEASIVRFTVGSYPWTVHLPGFRDGFVKTVVVESFARTRNFARVLPFQDDDH